jgi:hypothetical protein
MSRRLAAALMRRSSTPATLHGAQTSTTKEPNMRTYRRFQFMAGLALVFLALTMYVHGGWEAVMAAVAIFTGGAAAALLILLEGRGERRPLRGR